MHISLTPELKKIVKEKVESGMYGNASEVIRDAIRQMNRYEQLFHDLKKNVFFNSWKRARKAE